jgi:hypothetical protein
MNAERAAAGMWRLLASAIVIASAGDAEAAKLLLPAYANPCCNDGPAMWSGIVALGASAPQQLGVIFNPASGPGGAQVDPNYLGDNGQGPLADLVVTGAPVFGYVATGYATKSIATASAEVAQYYSDSYWRSHSQHLAGIFFDEMSNDLADVGYYRSLRDAVRALDPAAYIIGNPGVSETVNPSVQGTYSNADYAAVFDALIVFEDNGIAFASYVTPPWTAGAVQIGMIPIATATDAQMRATLSRALGRGANWICITDDVLPDPYDRLPTYWSDEVSLLPQLIFDDEFD